MIPEHKTIREKIRENWEKYFRKKQMERITQ